MTDGGYHPRLGGAASGQQKGSKRSKSSLRNRAQISVEGPQTRMNRAIGRQSSPIVVSVEPACHAGGRGFESVAPVSRSACRYASYVVCTGTDDHSVAQTSNAADGRALDGT